MLDVTTRHLPASPSRLPFGDDDPRKVCRCHTAHPKTDPRYDALAPTHRATGITVFRLEELPMRSRGGDRD